MTTIKPKILIVESDKDTQLSLLIGMELVGFEVDAAEDGKTALSLIRNVDYDLLIWDIKQRMEIKPLGNCMKLNRKPKLMVICKFPALHKVITSRFDLRVDVFLAKPFDPKAFFAAVMSLLCNSKINSG